MLPCFYRTMFFSPAFIRPYHLKIRMLSIDQKQIRCSLCITLCHKIQKTFQFFSILKNSLCLRIYFSPYLFSFLLFLAAYSSFVNFCSGIGCSSVPPEIISVKSIYITCLSFSYSCVSSCSLWHFSVCLDACVSLPVPCGYLRVLSAQMVFHSFLSS